MSDAFSYPAGVTPELLMAYADGALDAAETARVEDALTAHPELEDEVRAYRMTASALSGAFDAPMDEAVPGHLEALVMGTQGETGTVVSLDSRRARRAVTLPAWGQAIAACAVFGIGMVFGGQMLGGGGGSPGESPLLVAGQLSAEHPIAQALETSASARTIDIPGGRFDAVGTFPTASGVPCREFEATDDTGAVVGLACRRAGNWTIELLLHAETAGTPEGGFQLASGFDGEVIETVLTGLQAGIGLSADAETCLIENNWDPEACS